MAALSETKQVRRVERGQEVGDEVRYEGKWICMRYAMMDRTKPIL